jgi:hypothetical protein
MPRRTACTAPTARTPPATNGVSPSNGSGGTTGAAPCNCTPQQQEEAASIIGAVYILANLSLAGQIPDQAALIILHGLSSFAEVLDWAEGNAFRPMKAGVDAIEQDAGGAFECG